MTTKEDILKIVEYEIAKHGENARPIYEIMVFTNPDKELLFPSGKFSGMPNLGSVDNPGFYYSLDDAVEAVETNACDIWETCYDAAFVLCRFPGLYNPAGTDLRMYFVFDKEKKEYVQKEEPKIFAHYAY